MKVLSGQVCVCQVVASINENVGGPAYSVANLAQGLSGQNIDSHLFTLDYQEHGKQTSIEEVTVHSYSAQGIAKYLRGFQPNASLALQKLASDQLDLIHNHGLWMFPNLYARQAAVKNHLPLVISPRGMLEPWSLKNNWLKKLPAWYLYEYKNLKTATAFHATSDDEARSIRRFNFQQPIAIIPNGVNLPNLKNQNNREVLIKDFPELADKKWLLFLSRIHRKKGLDNLIFVWKNLFDKFSGWHLIIAGPDLVGYQAELELMTAQLELQASVTFTGMLSGEYKASALSNADLFVLPTHSENFGIVIAESLAYQVPVITTKGTPWQDLEHYKCGWWIDDTKQALTDALVEAMEMSVDERKVMGLYGRNLVQTKYAWEAITKQMASFYQWILGGGSPPNSVKFC